MENKKKPSIALISSIAGFVLFLLSGLAVGIGGLINWIPAGTYQAVSGVKVGYGVRASINNYWGLWRAWQFPNSWGYLGLTILMLAIVIVIAEIVLVILKKKYLYIIAALAHGVTLWFLPYLIVLGSSLWESGKGSGKGSVLVAGATVLCILGILALCYPFVEMLCKKEKKVEEEAADQKVDAVDEQDVRRIIAEELERHINELHIEEFEEVAEEPYEEDESEQEEVVEEPKQPVKEEPVKEEPVQEEAVEEQPAEEEKVEEPVEEAKAEEPVVEEKEEEPVEEQPAEEEPVQEEPAEEPAEEEADEGSDDDAEEADEGEEGEEGAEGDEDPFSKFNKRRRSSFESKLKKAEPELRQKYYELRDYIKSYGIKNRISIPGDTFSAHRERYVFLAFQGKHIKAYFALDPDAYAGSTIPVRKVEAKKFEDIPTLFKIQSDLSLKRAKKLVDDVMAIKGVQKVEEEPEEK